VTTFYWHDYETFGADPARDRPSQFAGIRTDEQFNIIGEPLTIYCQPAGDMLPHPEACLITGITPQEAQLKGVPEAEFIARIHEEFSQPGTCAVGYNSIRFDDEVTRYTLYRNFFDPYAREWKNGNSRWDIIDLVRVCRALRPEGIEWPDHQDGTPSFKLEHITIANGISHESAHDALSDVHATIAVARLIKEKQPKLYDYVLKLRNKREVAKLLNVVEKKPVLHTSAMFPASRFCTTLVMPLTNHPSNKNGVIAFDLSVDPEPLLTLSAEQIRERLYTPTAELPEGVERIPLKTIHLNRCPIVATTSLLNDAVAERLKIDFAKSRQYYQQLMAASDLNQKLLDVFSQSEFPERHDPDVMLYSGGFFSDADRNEMNQLRRCSAQELSERSFCFEDARLQEMLFRYRARNYPDSLNEQEFEQWQEYRYQRLTDKDGGGSIIMDEYLQIIEEKLSDEKLSESHRKVLNELLVYGDELLA
jgi:exodeoxyribonuclease-1